MYVREGRGGKGTHAASLMCNPVLGSHSRFGDKLLKLDFKIFVKLYFKMFVLVNSSAALNGLGFSRVCQGGEGRGGKGMHAASLMCHPVSGLAFPFRGQMIEIRFQNTRFGPQQCSSKWVNNPV